MGNPFAKQNGDGNKVNPFSKKNSGADSGRGLPIDDVSTPATQESEPCKPEQNINSDQSSNMPQGKEPEKQDRTSPGSFPFSLDGVENKEVKLDQDVQHQLKEEEFPNEDVAQIKKAFGMLQNSFDNKEDVMQIMKIILDMIKKNPEGLKPFVAPEDIGLACKALRQNYGIAIEKRGKRETKRQQSNQNVEQFVDALKGFNVDGM